MNVADIVALRCEGHIEGNRWLDGRTTPGDNGVGLVPTPNALPFTGTWWRVHDAGDGAIALECLGHVTGNRWLDGRTTPGDNSVGLAPNRDIPPFSGTRWTVVNALANFTFDDTISVENRGRLLDRHRFAVSRIVGCTNITDDEKAPLLGAYRRAIRHTTLHDPDANARATINGSEIQVNFAVLFPQGDTEISQTLIHELMHCAGFLHPTRRDPPAGMSCASPNPALFDCPFDNGVYYGTPPLRAELCIAGDQSDLQTRARAKADQESCIIDESGVATIVRTAE